MSAIDPRLIAWLAGSKAPQDSQEFRRRLAMLERQAGISAQAVRSDLQPQIDEVVSEQLVIPGGPWSYAFANYNDAMAPSTSFERNYYTPFTTTIIALGSAGVDWQFATAVGQCWIDPTLWNVRASGVNNSGANVALGSSALFIGK